MKSSYKLHLFRSILTTAIHVSPPLSLGGPPTCIAKLLLTGSIASLCLTFPKPSQTGLSNLNKNIINKNTSSYVILFTSLSYTLILRVKMNLRAFGDQCMRIMTIQNKFMLVMVSHFYILMIALTMSAEILRS